MMKKRRPGTGRRAWRCRVCAPGRWGLRAPAGRRRGVRPSKSRRPDAAGASRRRRTAAAAAPVSVSTPVSSPRRSTRTPVSHSTREPNQEKCPSFIVCLHCIYFDNSFFFVSTQLLREIFNDFSFRVCCHIVAVAERYRSSFQCQGIFDLD